MSGTEILRLEAVDVVRSGRRILTGIDLAIRSGEHWALIGANGAGKSTMLSMCGAEQHPTRGSVTVLGHQLGRVEIRKLRESIGHVNPRLQIQPRLTLTQVVLTGATGTASLMNRWEPDDALIARAGELIELLGLGAKRDVVWATMSQGERGRALIARALLNDPPLLLLDEPSTGLDVAAREQLLETLDHLHHTHPDLATVLVTHHMEELPESTTHAALIKDGRLTAQGPATDVLTTERVSDAFDHAIRIDYADGRWQARAGRAVLLA
ncbi:ABC transporter ATP-binding protein [Microbacterium halophytorum]|uniref:ABC transporter ATP-binding protein n=1 Tax=Microbacterium halophytorum TaxID=2067568 RepID=UPI000CFC3FD6|nr:ATP-binding cassette domain-containing protein [Microbacterium halophytorum]